MKDLFRGYYRLDDSELKVLWDSAIFIFDSNVLLNLYRYKPKTRDQLITVMEKLAGRVWIPYHVALEYQKNRISVISEQRQKFVKAKAILENFPSYVEQEFSRQEIKKRHSHIDDNEFSREIKAVVEKFIKKLTQQESESLIDNSDDNIRLKLDTLFLNSVGSKPKDQDWLDKLYSEGEKRYEHKIPPGFEDSKKGKEAYSYGGLIYKSKFGDLIVWKQIIEHAHKNKIKNIIFITGDYKKDWWYEVGGKTIGILPELTEEIKINADVERFYAYSMERFLEYSNVYLKAKIDEESIEDVREIGMKIEERLNYLDLNSKKSIAETAASIWVNSRLGEVIQTDGSISDFTMFFYNKEYGYRIKFLKDVTHIPIDMNVIWSNAYRLLLKHNLSHIGLVYVVEKIDDLSDEFFKLLHHKVDKLGYSCSVIVGIITEDISSEGYYFTPIIEIMNNRAP